MKTIITVKADEKEIKANIEAMEQSGSDMTRQIALDYIKGYLEE